MTPADRPQAGTPALRWHNDWVLWLAVLCFGGLLTGLSVARYVGFNSAMLDLGNMAQAIASVQRGQPLVFTNSDGPLSRLALHVELIYLLLAAPYALWPDPRLLLVIQAVLFALGALPVYRLTLRRTGSRYAARGLALIYLLYPTAQASVLFDLHGDTLALPLLMWALDALDTRSWRAYVVWLALALSCKFYVALPVALLGWPLWRAYGERRAALLTTLAGLSYGLVAFLIIRPLFTTAGSQESQRGLGYLWFYFSQYHEILPTLIERLLTGVVVFGPVLLLAWHGRAWLLPALPTALLSLLSSGPGGSYDYRYHHYATVVPFIIMAAVVGLARLQADQQAAQAAPRNVYVRRRRPWRGELGLTLAITAIFNIMLIDTPLNPLFWLGGPGYGIDYSIYGIRPRDSMTARFLEQQVPPNAPLAASNQMAPHLANRETLYLLRYPSEDQGPLLLPTHLPEVDYALADALFDLYIPLPEGYGGGLDGERAAIGLLLAQPDFGLVAGRDGLLLFERGAPPARTLTNTLTLLADDGRPAERQFGAPIALVSHELTLVGPRRVQARFTWRRTGDFEQLGRFVAVSQLDGLPDARMPHLPTYALLPSWQWPRGQLVQETFEVELPAETPPGRLTWRTGWYDVGLPASYATDARTLLPGSEQAALGEITLH